MNLFPEIKSAKWTKINLNTESLKTNIDTSNSAACNEWVKSLHVARKVDYSYGGFLEDRSNLWKNHYNKEIGAFIHLGVDFNVPPGTKVALLKKAKVVNVFIDEDQRGGWGGMVLWKIIDSPQYLIYGHLKHDIHLKKEQVCEAGTVFGTVGKSNENGGWFPHLHLQLMNQDFIDSFEEDIEKIDGYLPKNHPLLKNVINPVPLV